jgi:hypothetical protein
MAHACNPSYSGGRDQEDRGSKPAWENSLQDPILKKLITWKKKNQVAVAAWVYFWVLYSVPLVHMSVPGYFCYYGSVV